MNIWKMKGTACGDEYIIFYWNLQFHLKSAESFIWSSRLFNDITILLYLHCSHQTDYLLPDKH